MTDQEINIAIAQACGFKMEEDYDATRGPSWKWPTGQECEGEPPDYCNDLNAMHDAVNTLTPDQRNAFIDLLGETYHDSWEFCNATARQRAEAFLRTLNLWKE
jgi:hypothetical protein